MTYLNVKCVNYYIYRQKIFILGSRKIYVQNDRVTMGLLLGLVLAYIFMVELETALIRNLSSELHFWRHFVDNIICFVKKYSIKFVKDTLDNIHKNIKVTFEEEKKWKNCVFRDFVRTKQTLYSYNSSHKEDQYFF